MKICHMTSAHKSTDVRIFVKECVSLSDAGYDVTLVAPGESFEQDSIHIVGVGAMKATRLQRMVLSAYSVFKAARATDADVYHLHDPELLPYGLKLKRKGKYVIFDSHENILAFVQEKRWIPKQLRRPIQSIWLRFLRKALPQMDGLITVTPHMNEGLTKYNPNVVTVANFPIVSKEQTESKVVQRDVNQLCFAGGVNEQWCHEAIIEAIQTLPDARYVLAGKGTSGYLDRLHALDKESKVTYQGVIPHAEAQTLLQSSGVGMAICEKSANTIGAEGSLGNTKLFEEMLAELPVIATNFSSWREILDEGPCGICVEPNDRKAIREAIQWMQAHPLEARTMGKNGRKLVLERFNWESEKEKLLSFYATNFIKMENQG